MPSLAYATHSWPPSPLVPRSEYPCITVAPGVFYLLTNLLLLAFPYAIWLSALLPKLSFLFLRHVGCHPAGTDASTEPFPLQFPLSGRLVSSVMPAPVLAGDRWWGPSADRPCVATQLTLVLPPCTWHLFVIFLSSLFSSFTAGIAIEIVSVIHLF